MNGHVSCVGKMRNACNILVGKAKGRGHSEDIDVEGKIILERILGKCGGKFCTGCI